MEEAFLAVASVAAEEDIGSKDCQIISLFVPFSFLLVSFESNDAIFAIRIWHQPVTAEERTKKDSFRTLLVSQRYSDETYL